MPERRHESHVADALEAGFAAIQEAMGARDRERDQTITDLRLQLHSTTQELRRIGKQLDGNGELPLPRRIDHVESQVNGVKEKVDTIAGRLWWVIATVLGAFILALIGAITDGDKQDSGQSSVSPAAVEGEA